MKNKIFDFINSKINYIFVIEAFLVAMALTINLDKNIRFRYSFNNNTYLFVIVFIAIFCFFFKVSQVSKKLEKRGKVVSIVLAIIYALIDVVGYTYNTYQESIFETWYLIKISIRFIGFYLITNKIIQLSFYAIKNKFCESSEKEKNANESFFSKLKNKKIIVSIRDLYNSKSWFRILVISVLFFICYLPYYLQYYPGSACFDGQWQMGYVSGIEPFSNHHPVFHTIFIAFFMKIADAVGGGNNLAIAMYCFTQMCINAVIFSFTFEYLRKLKTPTKVRKVLLLIFLLVPIFPLYSITLWKDTVFALAFSIFTIFLTRIYIDGDEFFSKKKNIVYFIICIIFTSLLRNNGIYVVVLSFPFLAYIFRKYLKYIVTSFGIAFLFCFAWNVFIHDGLNVKHTETKEMLSVPSQAFARAYKYNFDELTSDEKNGIEKFIQLSEDEIKSRYNPVFSDPIRYNMSDQIVDENLGELIKLYFHLFWKYPKTVIDSFVDGCYGYIYPSIKYFRVSAGVDSETLKNSGFYFYDKLDIHADGLIDSKLISFLADISNDGDRTPFINMFFSIGLWFEMLLYLIGYNIYNRKTKRILLFVPMLFLILTCYVSPVFAEFRYIYSLFTTMPIFVAYTLFESNKDETIIEKKDEKKMKKENTTNNEMINDSKEGTQNEITNKENDISVETEIANPKSKVDVESSEKDTGSDNNTEKPNAFFEKIMQIYGKYKNILYVAFLLFLIGYMTFYIFVGCKFFINSDSTFFIDYSLEQIETEQFFPKYWVHGNDFWVYSLIPLLTLFLKLGIGLFASRQLAVFIQSVLLIMLIVDLFSKEIKNKSGSKIALLLILSGVSGMFAFEVFGDATYGTIIFYMLLEVLLFIKVLNRPKHKILFTLAFSIIMALITACSLRFPIYIGAPLICVLLYFIYNNKIKKDYVIIGLVLIISIVVGFLLHNYLKSKYILYTQYGTRNVVNSSTEVDTNLSSILFNYLTSCGASGVNTRGLSIILYNYEIQSSSPLVVLTFARYLFALVTVIIPFYLLKNIKKLNLAEKIFLIYTVSLMFLILFFLLVGNMASWHRYINPVLFFMILLYPIFYRCFAESDYKKKVLFIIYMALCVSTALFFTATSMLDFRVFNSNNSSTKTDEDGNAVVETIPFAKVRVNPYQEVTDFLVEKGLDFGYIYGSDEHSIFYTLSEGKVRVLRIKSSGKEAYFWLNSQDWYKKNYHAGKTFLIRKKSAKSLTVEKKANEEYEVKDYVIFVFKKNETIRSTLSNL